MENDQDSALGLHPMRVIHLLTQNGADDYWRGVCEERGRISCELHDGLFPHLNAAALRLQNMTEDLLERTMLDASVALSLRGEMSLVQSLLTLASAQMRAWLRDQPTAYTGTESLEAAMRRIASTVETSAGGACRIYLKIGDGIPPLCSRTRWELTCIGQEALRNATRHGSARTVEMRLEHLTAERSVRLRVRDDGRGFDLNSRPSDGSVHFGLNAMRLRAERLGGTFAVESMPDAGTTVTSCVPIDPHPITNQRHWPRLGGQTMSLDH